ncbi:hypothetical protein THAOC_25766 [Thalassiosira oceanica]|uniref:Uncharacterized protein n=1 Tax=Thalassiosira oceanica TaxID=159749 RepID=K0RQG5_THAOC|nr:hypothetical protein THAOC_25766 [Thalassiosira oceanica]|eukprot:EJK54589.1 hypothetical protein THAOC_25766 [Thalassiosira oceanica]
MGGRDHKGAPPSCLAVPQTLPSCLSLLCLASSLYCLRHFGFCFAKDPPVLFQGKRQTTNKKRLERIQETGAFLTVRPSRRDGTELERDEFRDAVLLRMGLVPKNLPKTCDGCGATFTVEHALTCKTGGLVVLRHDDCRDEFGDIASKATTPSRVTTESLIQYAGNEPVTRWANKDSNTSNNNNSSTRGGEERGNLAIHGFVQRQKTAILDFVITDTDAPS